ncbi:MAG: polysaccharide biosynthesis protein, partial [Olleya sp.]
STTLPTYNSKIMIAKVENCTHTEINKDIHELIALAKEDEKNAIVKKMKDIVPEFLSMNSDFEVFDKKIV